MIHLIRPRPTKTNMRKAAGEMRKVAKDLGRSSLYIVPFGNRGRRDLLWVKDVDDIQNSVRPHGHADKPEGAIFLTRVYAVGAKNELPTQRQMFEIVLFAYRVFSETWEATMNGDLPLTPPQSPA